MIREEGSKEGVQNGTRWLRENGMTGLVPSSKGFSADPDSPHSPEIQMALLASEHYPSFVEGG
jgi:hypothetical protein